MAMGWGWGWGGDGDRVGMEVGLGGKEGGAGWQGEWGWVEKEVGSGDLPSRSNFGIFRTLKRANSSVADPSSASPPFTRATIRKII